MEHERLVARSFEEWQARRARGEAVDPDTWSDGLGEAYEDFLALVEMESSLDALLEPPLLAAEPLPRDFGPFTLLRVLGRGATGVVYEAVNRGLGRREAVKVLRTGFEDGSAALERFRREARALARVRHDHVVEVYGAGEAEGRSWYAMSIVDGPSLADLARRGELPPPRELCGLLAPVADALQTLHDTGIVHRDVKPSNILRDADGRLVLADFGLARDADGHTVTTTGQALGTPIYMSPEQILGDRKGVDGRTDVYCLGATLYQLLAGRPPFTASDVRALMRQVLADRPEPVRRVVPDVPAACEAIVLKCLEKRREDRYATAAALRDDLDACARGGRVVGRPVGRVRRSLRRARRYALPLAAAILVTVGAVVWWNGRPGTLRVDVLAGTHVLVDGTPRGEVPLTVELPAGRHTVALDHPWFRPIESGVDLSPGEEEAFILDPRIGGVRPDLGPVEHAEALALAAAFYQVDGRGFLTLSPHRGAGKEAEPFRLLWPVGTVRPQDVTELRIELSDDAPFDGLSVTLQRGGAVLFSHVIDPDDVNLAMTIPVPEDVRAALDPGDRIDWQVAVRDRQAAAAHFEVRMPEAAVTEGLARLEDALASYAADERAFLVGRRLLAEGLPLAALARARSAAREVPGSLIALGLEREALLALGAKDSIALREVEARLLGRDVDAAARAALFTVTR